MENQGRIFKVFTANSNPKLAAAIAKELGCELGKAEVKWNCQKQSNRKSFGKWYKNTM